MLQNIHYEKTLDKISVEKKVKLMMQQEQTQARPQYEQDHALSPELHLLAQFHLPIPPCCCLWQITAQWTKKF